MDKEENSNDGAGGEEKTKDVESPPEVIEVKDSDSQDGKSSPIGVESPSRDRWVMILTWTLTHLWRHADMNHFMTNNNMLLQQNISIILTII